MDMKKRGLGLPVGSMFSRTPDAQPEQGDEDAPQELQVVPMAEAPPAEETQEAEPQPRPRPRRSRKTPTASGPKGRKIYLADELFFRLRLLSLQKGEKVSTVAAEILDKALPRFEVRKVA